MYSKRVKNVESCRIKYKDCEWCVKYTNAKDDLRKQMFMLLSKLPKKV